MESFEESRSGLMKRSGMIRRSEIVRSGMTVLRNCLRRAGVE